MNIKDILENLAFDNEELEQELSGWSLSKLINNPAVLERFINDDDVINSGADLSALNSALQQLDDRETTISKEDIKIVFLALKNRDENPRGTFDSRGRWYSDESELLDVRNPSASYPYSQMNACRTAKFVKALANKYRCQSLQDLQIVAYA